MVPSDPSHRSMHELWSVQRVRTRSDQASPIVLWRKFWPQHKCCRAAYHVGWRCRAEVVSGEVQQAWRPAFARGFPRREGVGVQRRAEGILLCCLHEHGTIVSLLRLQQQQCVQNGQLPVRFEGLSAPWPSLTTSHRQPCTSSSRQTRQPVRRTAQIGLAQCEGHGRVNLQ